MRIGIFLNEWRDGGVPVFLDRLEQFLTNEGHEVFLFLAHPYPKREKIPKDLYVQLKKRLGNRCVSLDINSFPATWRAAYFQKAILARGIACLLINQFDNYIGLLETIAAQIPLISVAHTDSDHYYLEFLRSMEMTQAHIAVSKRILEKTLLLTAPEKTGRIKYIPYGIEDSNDRFHALPKGPLRAVYSARLDPVQKRCQDLVPVWKGFLRQGGKGELTILGTGKNAAFIQSSFHEEIATGKVRMLGQVSTMEALDEMAKSDVVLNFSNFEGLPQVVLEGASLGLYPVLSDIESGHREIIETLGVGTICHIGDINGFARELIRLEKELITIRQQREYIRNVTLHHYPLRRCYSQYLEVMQSVGLESPIPLKIKMPARPLREWIRRACLWVKYRRHFGS
jgi:glycosyltransferase involved in cell wall biosynthesis